MKNRKITENEKKKVLGYCEFVSLFTLSIIINFKLAVGLLILSPIILPVILGIKERNCRFFDEKRKDTKELVNREFCA